MNEAQHVDKSFCNTETQSDDPADVDEELFCPTLSSAALAPLALGAFLGPSSDVLKQGYLGKQEQKHRRYFVLRAGSHSGPSRLEWYKTQDKFRADVKSAGDKGLFGSHRQGVIFLRCCLGVSLIRSRNDFKVALYAKDQTLVFVGKDEQEQQEWYAAVQELMEEEIRDGEGDRFDDEDAGYCTLPPVSLFKQVWPVTVTPRGLGRSKALSGEILLCLTASALVLVRVGHDHELPSVTLPLLAVRRFGHLEGLFFLELGRGAPHGPGEIWMQAKDEGNRSLAQYIHEVVREAVRALRIISDFNWFSSPNKSSSSLSHSLFDPKRSRPKPREKQHRRQNSCPSPRVLRENLYDSTTEDSLGTDSVSLSPVRTQPSYDPEAESYVEMKSENSPLGERPQYMLMSPQLSPSLHQDEYMSMISPRKNTSLSFLQTSCSSDSDVHVLTQTSPPWTLFSGQHSTPSAATPWATSSPVTMRPFAAFRRSSLEMSAAEPSVRKRILSCLPSCLQPE
ncbi:unnamed protein product [Knipowitschia caucasica]|uniref:Insulin receptor substrate 1 n=1 Tax=Knipowitschia caucasica TaxID=637954 RepID=A0AAV2LDC8_KNICA